MLIMLQIYKTFLKMKLRCKKKYLHLQNKTIYYTP
jgi:hypothetical protein